MTESSIADFVFSTPKYSVKASGGMRRVAEKDALDVARQVGSGVVGLIPFSPDAEPYLLVPDQLEVGAPLEGKQTELPEPSSLEGVENPGFRAAVGEAVRRMNNGELDKVVLSRLLHAHYDGAAPAPADIYGNLLVQQPKAFVFSVKLEDEGHYLMGASPELVFGTDEEGFTTFPLAGTAARTAEIGSTEDAQTGENLMKSVKDRTEHATVIDDIRARLEPLTEELNVPAVPSLVTTPQLWHLGTRITGKLKAGISSLDGARAIHPTPAICGFPTQTAYDLISELEDFDRGFFGGLVGWMRPDGTGEWALTLRCADITPTQATLFAGAGIVKASIPVSEHAETGNKLGSFGKSLGIKTV